MTLNSHEPGNKRHPSGETIAFTLNGEAWALPDTASYVQALRSSNDPLFPLVECSAQVLWLLEGFEEASRALTLLAPGVKVSNTETLHPRLRTIIVCGPASRDRASFFQQKLQDPILISQGDPAASLSEHDHTIRILGQESAHVNSMAGIVAMLLAMWPDFSAREVQDTLLEIARHEA